eukprot:COSAG01_NODE_6246_length_3772_cov_4.769398_5_plen_234_part_00
MLTHGALARGVRGCGARLSAITWGLLGPTAALWRLAGAIVLSIASGMAVPSSCRAAATTAGAPAQGGAKAAAGGDPHPHARAPAAAPRSVRSLCEMVVGLADDVFPSVLLGLCLSTVVRRRVARNGRRRHRRYRHRLSTRLPACLPACLGACQPHHPAHRGVFGAQALHLAPQLATTYASLQVSGALVGSPALPGWGRSLLTRLAVLAASLCVPHRRHAASSQQPLSPPPPSP